MLNISTIFISTIKESLYAFINLSAITSSSTIKAISLTIGWILFSTNCGFLFFCSGKLSVNTSKKQTEFLILKAFKTKGEISPKSAIIFSPSLL